MQPGDGPKVLVPTIMRSGTHVLIDLILNNFPKYKRSPLMVMVDQFYWQPVETREKLFEQLYQTGGYVVKTHYPQVGFHQPWRAPHFERLIPPCRIVTVERDREETYRSSAKWYASEPRDGDLRVAATREEYERTANLFDEYWKGHEVLRLDFRRVLDPTSTPKLISEIADWIGAEPRSRPVPPFPKNARTRVFVSKALTRMIGRRAPVVNTTLRFAK
jgi:hypothetical protein